MNPAALLAWGVAALVLLSAQAAPTGDSKGHKDIFEINQEAGLLGRACPGFKCDKDCDFGYDTNTDGCFVCSCIPENKDVMYQGDMLLDRQGKNRVLHGDSGNRAAIEGMHWPRVVPYVIEDSIAPGSRGRSAIAEAIAEFHKHTCLRFFRRTSEAAYISFYRGSGCSSPVGYFGRVNWISLAGGCWHKGTVIHEIMHSLGFYHEQSRPDRDDYVEILWDNIPNGMSYNFKRRHVNQIDSLGTPYDYKSIMHYGKTAFGAGRVTIRTKDKEHVIGQRSGLSKLDIQQLNLRYKCGGSGTPTSPAAVLICEDKHKDDCPAWKSLCSNSQYMAFMHKNCPKTCALCGGVGSTVASTAASTAAPTTAPIAGPICEDYMDSCPRLKIYCGINGHVDRTCAKTCGTCGGGVGSTAAPIAGPICEDYTDSCQGWKRHCGSNGYMKRNCAKTCGTCGGGVEPCQRGDGASYRGTVSVTETGKTCQRWDSQTTHGHSHTPANHPYSGLVENYCRNPSGWSGVWCYTTDPSSRWERCDVPVCGGISTVAVCQDKNPDCPDWKYYCKRGQYIPYMEQFCPKTCDTCGSGGALNADPAGAPAVRPCEDTYRMCPRLKRHCGDPKYQTKVKFCPKTCGTCGRGEAPDAEAVCEDMHPTCPKRKRHCGKKRMQKFCPKTCGRCASVI